METTAVLKKTTQLGVHFSTSMPSNVPVIAGVIGPIDVRTLCQWTVLACCLDLSRIFRFQKQRPTLCVPFLILLFKYRKTTFIIFVSPCVALASAAQIRLTSNPSSGLV